MSRDVSLHSDNVGRLLFGKPSRLRLAMWLAVQPTPRTFTQTEYWEFCKDYGWGGAHVSIRPELNRFLELGMVKERPDLSKGSRMKFWTKTPSPLWPIFKEAARAMNDRPPTPEPPSPAARRRAERDLLALARSLQKEIDG